MIDLSTIEFWLFIIGAFGFGMLCGAWGQAKVTEMEAALQEAKEENEDGSIPSGFLHQRIDTCTGGTIQGHIGETGVISTDLK